MQSQGDQLDLHANKRSDSAHASGFIGVNPMVRGLEASPDANFDGLRHESISSCKDTLHRPFRLFSSLFVRRCSSNASIRTCSMRFDSYDTNRRNFLTVDAMSDMTGYNFIVDELGSVTTSGMDSQRSRWRPQLRSRGGNGGSVRLLRTRNQSELDIQRHTTLFR